jgi:hypothetical protein
MDMVVNSLSVLVDKFPTLKSNWLIGMCKAKYTKVSLILNAAFSVNAIANDFVFKESDFKSL